MKLNIRFAFVAVFVFFFLSCSKDDNELQPDDSNDPAVINYEFELTFDSQILNAINSFQILKIIKNNDGFILFTQELITEFPFDTGIRITKIDHQFNLVWTFLINESIEIDKFSGVFELPNDEYIAMLKRVHSASDGLNYNEVYGLKFNNLGNILWQKDYSTQNVDSDARLDEIIDFTNESNELKVMFRSDSTYYNADDAYFREVKLNAAGDVLSTTILNYTDVNQFYNIIYDQNGSKYNFGGRLLVDFYIGNSAYVSYNALLIKYDVNNQVIYDKTYGVQRADDYFHEILIDNNNKPIMVGKCGLDTSNNPEGRWIAEINAVGDIVWEIKEINENVRYYGKDIIQDDDGNYLSLFYDINFGFDIATLIKSDHQGNIIWKFQDGPDGNDDSFVPYKVFKRNDEYLIFGLKDDKLWIKKVKIQ